MPPNDAIDSSALLVIEFEGGIADGHELTLDRYVDSVTGWRDFFTVATEMYLRSRPELQNLRRDQLFELRIDADRPGSYDVALGMVIGAAGAAAAGIIGNRADAAFVALCRALWAWYRRLIATHIDAKRASRNVDDIVAALEAMSQAEGVDLQQSARAVPAREEVEDDFKDDFEPADAQSPARKLVDKIDTALQLAVSPIGPDCNTIKVVDPKRVFAVATFGASEKQVLDGSLTLPPPDGLWRSTSVKFERINNKTGRALIYVWRATRHADTASYARIVDRSFTRPGNVYAKAFAENSELIVWARQVRAERGRLNLMWEITCIPPEQLPLYGPEGTRA